MEKSKRLQNVSYAIRGPVLDEAQRMENQGFEILKLNIGNPPQFGLNAPDEILKDMVRNIASAQGYSLSKGIFSARKAIMQYYQLKGVYNIDVEDIFIGNGSSELIMMCMQALINNGDEVLVPTPDYPLWTASVTLSGGTPVHYICDEQNDWNPSIEDMKSKVTEKTKAIVIINPNNPTGAVYPKEILLQIIDIARENNLMIFSDEIYDHLIIDKSIKHVSVASLADDVFIATLSGISKSHRVTGFRAGWVVFSGDREGSRDYIDGVNTLASMRLCSNVTAQSIIQTALGGYQSIDALVSPGGRIYEQCMYAYEALNAIPGITCTKPKSAFYLFPKMDVERFNIKDDEKFALDLLKAQRMLVVHGTGFNWIAPDHFRIVCLADITTMRDAMKRLATFFAHYKQK